MKIRVVTSFPTVSGWPASAGFPWVNAAHHGCEEADLDECHTQATNEKVEGDRRSQTSLALHVAKVALGSMSTSLIVSHAAVKMPSSARFSQGGPVRSQHLPWTVAARLDAMQNRRLGFRGVRLALDKNSLRFRDHLPRQSALHISRGLALDVADR